MTDFATAYHAQVMAMPHPHLLHRRAQRILEHGGRRADALAVYLEARTREHLGIDSAVAVDWGTKAVDWNTILDLIIKWLPVILSILGMLVL